MRKWILTVLILGIICGMNITVYASDVDFGDLLGSMAGMSSDSIGNDVSMPDAFSITYEYVENGMFKEVTMEKDEQDNYHYKDSEDEFLFIKDGNGYRIAIGTVNGFVQKNEEKYTFGYVKEKTILFWGCVNPLEDDYIMGTKTEEGIGEICGRSTKKYKIEWGMNYNMGGYNMSMSDASYFEIDDVTGICLASSSNSDFNVMGIGSSEEGTDGFECIRFEVENIVLPGVQ